MTGLLDATVARPDESDTAAPEWPRVMACCLGLAALAFVTRSGYVLADTKLDLSVDPLGFLGRALRLWDPGQLGQVQNQTAGYLFPTGPFFALCAAIGMPMWIAQRLWMALLLCTAFLGVRRLAERLGFGTPAARLLGGLAYALAPNGLSVLGQITAEYLPYALLPWTVIPLVGSSSVRRAVARSGLAVAACGGINGTATLAVVLVPLFYLLTGRRLRVAAWWSVTVGAATSWWSIPLLLDGRYAFSWLTYTEKAAVTTGPTGLPDILRGTERWVSHLVVDGRIESPTGLALATGTVGILCTTTMAALGLAGLIRRDLPERRFVLVTFLTGVLIISAGHAGPLAAPVRDLIDGPLAALRNLHKFDALVRLPLALGLIHLLTPAHAASADPVRASVRWPDAEGARWLGSVRRWVGCAGSLVRGRGVLWGAVVALAGVAGTAAVSGLSASGDFQRVPGYWRSAAAWLNSRGGGVVALPGAGVGDYRWGRTGDDVLQPLVKERWAARQLVPWGSPGFTRILDAIDQRIVAGTGSPGLAETIGRLGVRYVVVRNDLTPSVLDGKWPERVGQVLAGSPGFMEVAAFGKPAKDAFEQAYPPVQIYQVTAAPVVGLADAGSALRLYGAPESMLTLADAGLLGGRPVLFDDDGPGLAGVPVVSDGLRAVDRDFGLPWQVTPTLTRAEALRIQDVVAPGWERYATFAEYAGIAAVSASSARSDTGFLTDLHDLGFLPYAALDGDPGTRWESDGVGGVVGQWLRVDFTAARTPHRVTVAFGQGLGPAPSLVEVRTEAGSSRQAVRATAARQPLRVPAGPTPWLRIRVLRTTAGAASDFPRVGISELAVDRIAPVRSYRLPAVPAALAVMARSPGARPGCMEGSAAWVCSPFLGRGGEESGRFERSFTLQAGGAASVSGSVVLARLPDAMGSVRVTGSSTLTADPADQGRSAFDGDPATSWISAPGDRDPTLMLDLPKRVRIDRLDLVRPGSVMWVRLDGDPRTWTVDAAGQVRFPARTAKRLVLHLGTVGGPAQISELRIPGVRPAATPRDVVLPCGSGPRLLVDGVPMPTRASGTGADVLAGRPIRFASCGDVVVRAGENRLSAPAGQRFEVESAIVGTSLAPAASTVPLTVRHGSVSVRTTRAALLVVGENFNRGWRATLGGRSLRTVRVDGWKQAWLVPAGTKGTIRLTYGPERLYRVAVFGGLGLVLVLVVLALAPGGRPMMRRIARPGWPLALMAIPAGFWLAGLAGVAAVLVATLLPRKAWIPVLLLTIAVAVPWQPQLAGVLAVATVWPRPERAARPPGD